MVETNIGAGVQRLEDRRESAVWSILGERYFPDSSRGAGPFFSLRDKGLPEQGIAITQPN